MKKKKKEKDKFYRRHLKQGTSFVIIYTMLGIFFSIIFSNSFKNDLDFSKTAKTTKAQIVDIEYRWAEDNVSKVEYQLIGDKEAKYIVVEYIANNIKYTGVSRDINSHMYIGKNVNIYYNQTDPQQFIVINYFSNIIPIILSSIFIIAGSIGIIIQIKKIIRYIETLNGVEIKVDIVKVIEIHKPWGTRYKIECTGKDEAGDTYTFYSRNFDEPYLEHEIEKMELTTLKVRYKKYHPKKYIVLTESLERRLSR